MEKRIYNIETRIDSNDDGKEIVVGHASMYNTRSEFMGFYETIEEGAFTDELRNARNILWKRFICFYEKRRYYSKLICFYC